MNEKEVLSKLHYEFKAANDSFNSRQTKEAEESLANISVNLYEFVRELYGNKFMEKLYRGEITEIVKLIEKQTKESK